MTSRNRVLAKHPTAVAMRGVGAFAGGRVHYVEKLSPTARKIAGYGQRESWALVDACPAPGLGQQMQACNRGACERKR